MRRWDLIAHVHEAELQLQMLPALSYWNGFSSLGYEPFVSYSLLPRLGTALLGAIVGVPLATELCLALAWTSYPWALFGFFRTSLVPDRALVAVGLSLGLLFCLPYGFGYDYISAFRKGNYAAILAFPFFVIAVTFLLQRRYWGAAIFVAVVTLTHVLSAGILLGVVAVAILTDRNAATALAGFGLAGFWLIPYLTEGYKNVTPFIQFITPLLIFLPFVLFNLWYFWRNSPSFQESVLHMSSFGLLLLCMYGFWDPQAAQLIPLHYHRVFIPLGLFLLPLFIARIDFSRCWFSSSQIAAALFVVGVGLSANSIVEAYHFARVESVPDVPSRGVFALNAPDEAMEWHNIVYRYIRKYNKRVMPALFVEAWPTAELIFAVQRGLNGYPPPQWGAKQTIPFPEELEKSIQNSYQHLPLFMGAGAAVRIGDCEGVYSEDCIESGTAPTVVAEVPETVERWKNRPHDRVAWLKDLSQGLYAKGAWERDIPSGAKAEVVEIDEHWNRLEVSVDASSSVPLHLKVTAREAWRAVDSTGDPLEIYRAFPLGMVVESNRDFTLQFDKYRTSHRFGILVSVLTLALLGLARRQDWIADKPRAIQSRSR